jgi:hypothetical protein
VTRQSAAQNGGDARWRFPGLITLREMARRPGGPERLIGGDGVRVARVLE